MQREPKSHLPRLRELSRNLQLEADAQDSQVVMDLMDTLHEIKEHLITVEKLLHRLTQS